ncbi:MAG: recombination protein NinG, partial [Calditrichia bacterium]
MVKKTKTLGRLKKDLWKLFSLYIRKKYADDNGYVSCVTCGLTKHYTQMQAGHFIPRAQGNATYFEETNVHPQDYRCNINLGGNGPEYYAFMERT